MKTLWTAALLAVFAMPAWAQTYKVTWTLTGFTAGGTPFSSLELDVQETGRYLAAHGALLTETRQLSPVTGTCARLNNGGFFCNLQVDRNSYFLTLDSQLNGKITGRDSSGNTIPESTATLYRRE